MPYIPLHDRPPFYGNLPSPSASHNDPAVPRYASPDLGASVDLGGEMSGAPRPYSGGSDRDDFEGFDEVGAGAIGGPASMGYATLALNAEALETESTNSTASSRKRTREGSREQAASGSSSPAPRSGPTTLMSSSSRSGYVPRARVPEDAPDAPDALTKRIRLSTGPTEIEDGDSRINGNGDINAAAGPSRADPPTHQARPAAPPTSRPRYIHGSFFHMTARNPVTRTIGDWILATCRDRHNIEIEVKLGQVMTPAYAGQRSRRVRLPAMTELILPPDYDVGSFRSDMSKPQHASLNRLLNEAVVGSDPRAFRPDPSNPSARPPYPIKFFRQRQIDKFYYSGGHKTRVSRDTRTGDLLACIVKTKVADLNIANGTEMLDFRVSVSTEEPCEMPTGAPNMTREKDRACYRHQLVQIDLTYVKQSSPDGTQHETYELEIEVVDAPGLVAEGLKEEKGEPNQYDEMITSILDSARILIRNVGR